MLDIAGICGSVVIIDILLRLDGHGAGITGLGITFNITDRVITITERSHDQDSTATCPLPSVAHSCILKDFVIILVPVFFVALPLMHMQIPYLPPPL